MKSGLKKWILILGFDWDSVKILMLVFEIVLQCKQYIVFVVIVSIITII